MDTFTDILLDLENPVETTRTRAVINLVRCNDIKAIPHLERAADHDESAQIRYLARKGLKLLKDKAIDEERRRQETHFFASDIEQTVETLVISPDGDDRRRGFQLAARINDPVLYPLLENAYTREETPFLRPFMLRVLAVVGGSKSRHHIEEALESPEHRLRACAVETAAAIRDDELLEKVVPLLRDRDNRVAANATLALKDYGSITVLETLKKMLESPEAGRRDSAAYALAELKNETALPLLAKAARDRAKTIRAKAFTGLEALADDGLAEAAQLIEKLKQEDEEGLADY
ncbi:MAG: HEAT repeat domain-containing protein, partial [bacterium]|nr:HEAT repeat domain-containing protein [bacterium]